MPWWDGLAPETIQELRRRNPGLELEEIAVRAVRDPRWAKEFARLGATVESGDVFVFAFVGPDVQPGDIVTRPRGEHEPAENVWVPERDAAAFRDLVVAAMLAGDEDGPGPATPDVGRAHGPRRSPQPKTAITYGHPAVDYSRGQIAVAVRRWRDGGRKRNVSEISRRTQLSRPLIMRIGRLDDHGAFELGPRGGLRVLGRDGTFRAADASVSIRALEKALGLAPPA